MSTLAIVEAFEDLPDGRRGAGRRHQQALCLSISTLAVSAGCRGFLAISDWLDSYREELLELFVVRVHPTFATKYKYSALNQPSGGLLVRLENRPKM